MPQPKDQDVKLVKQFVAEDIKVDSDERTVTAVISTGEVDRDGEVLVPKGVDFEHFNKNPVVLYGHDSSSLPIGKAMWIKQQRGKITALVQFADTEFAEEVFQLFKGGFLNAFSVGFINKSSHKPTPKEIAKRPELADVWRVIDEWELLEFSAVAVPSNPGALATAVKAKTITLSQANMDALGIEPEERPDPAMYKNDDGDTKTIPDKQPVEPPLIVVAKHVPVVRQHIPMKSHRVIRLQTHINPADVAESITRLMIGKVT